MYLEKALLLIRHERKYNLTKRHSPYTSSSSGTYRMVKNLSGIKPFIRANMQDVLQLPWSRIHMLDLAAK